MQVVAILFEEDAATLAKIGSGSAYLMREELKCITDDHPYYEVLVDHGSEVSDADRERMLAHHLRKGLGAEDREIIDLEQVAVRPGDTFVLCADGLSNNLSPPDIERILRSNCDRAQALLQSATGPDCAVDDAALLSSTWYDQRAIPLCSGSSAGAKTLAQ